jgi:glycerol kinase
MQWLLENVPKLRDRTSAGEICFGTVDSWLIWMLTEGKVHKCDVSNASRTQLLNLGDADWDEDLLALFGIPRAALPVVTGSSEIFGECSGIDGLGGVPIASALGDSHAALAGHACFVPGTVKATYGTGSSLMTLLPGLTNSAARSKLVSTIAWKESGAGVQYALEGNISMAGSAVQWVGEFLGLANPSEDTLSLASTVKDSGGVYFVPAMVGLGAPYWDNSARGTITGLGRKSCGAHLAFAAIEAIAFQVKDVFEATQEEASCELLALHADGGAARNDWLMQFQADLLGRPVVRSQHEDLSALGAARFGGLTLGWWRSLEELTHLQSGRTTFYPNMSAEHRESRYREWQLAVQRARLQSVRS